MYVNNNTSISTTLALLYFAFYFAASAHFFAILNSFAPTFCLIRRFRTHSSEFVYKNGFHFPGQRLIIQSGPVAWPDYLEIVTFHSKAAVLSLAYRKRS